METNWSNLFQMLREVALSEITPEISAAILSMAVELRNVEYDLLSQIGQDAGKLTEPPFMTAIAHLDEAANAQISEEEQPRLIQTAKDKLIETQVLEKLRRNDFRQALAEYRIGLCWTLLGDHNEAQKFYQAAFNSAWNFVVEMNRGIIDQDHKRRVARNKVSIFFRRICRPVL